MFKWLLGLFRRDRFVSPPVVNNHYIPTVDDPVEEYRRAAQRLWLHTQTSEFEERTERLSQRLKIYAQRHG